MKRLIMQSFSATRYFLLSRYKFVTDRDNATAETDFGILRKYIKCLSYVRGHRTLLFGRIQTNVKKEKLLKIMFFQSQLLEYFT
jgi:hypothetical protein